MTVYDFFTQCEVEMPENRTPLRRTSFALRRAGVDTMDKLCALKQEQPEALAHLRDIGPQSLTMIEEVVQRFGKAKTTDQTTSNDVEAGARETSRANKADAVCIIYTTIPKKQPH